MLGILLLILKIIGWMLLGLVCLFLALLLLILFVPVPYRFQAEFGDGFTYRLKIFGIQIYPMKEKPGRRKRRRRKRKARVEGESSKEGTKEEASDVGEGGQEKSGSVQDEPQAKELRDGPGTQDAKETRGEPGTQDAKESQGEPGTQDAKESQGEPGTQDASKQTSLQELSGTEKPPDMGRKKPADEPGYTGGKKKPKDQKFKAKKFKTEKFGKNKFQKKKSAKKKQDKKKRETKSMDMDALRQKWELLRTELTDEGNRRAANHGFSEIAYVLRHCGPRRVKADIAYSLADPANTGYVTAVLCICPFVYGKGCEIIPDFESEKMYARGWLDVRGHVRLVHFGLSGIRLLIDRDIRAIIRKVRR